MKTMLLLKLFFIGKVKTQPGQNQKKGRVIFIMKLREKQYYFLFASVMRMKMD